MRTVLSKLRLGPKLLLAPGVLLVLLLVLSAGAYLGLLRQNQSLDNIVQQRAVRLKATADLVASAHKAHTGIYQLLTWINGSFSAPRVDALVRELHRRHAALDRQFAQLEMTTQSDPAERRFVSQSQAAHAVYVKAIQEVIELALADQSLAANAMAKAERAFDVVAQRLEELSRLEHSLSERAYADAEADFRLLSTWMPILVLASVALSLLLTMAVRNAMLHEVREIGAAAVDLAEGNLTVRQRVYGKDEIADTARALDTSIRNLNTTLKTMLASARSIDSAARDIAQGNTLLARRGRAQAETLAQARGDIEQVGTRLAQGASDTGQARELAQRAHSFAARGGNVLQRLLVTMALLRGGTRRMADAAGVVDSLALQAQMLALSAAVEAARAGEHGHGFAVLAAEVRALAQRSASAVLEIRALIDDTATALDNGTHTAGEVGASLTGLVDAVRQLADLLAGIDDSHARQARDVQDVRQAIGGMDQVTQQNLVLVQQAAAAAGSLQRQALYLSQAVAAFKLDEGVAPPDHTCPAGSPRVVRLRLASVRT